MQPINMAVLVKRVIINRFVFILNPCFIEKFFKQRVRQAGLSR